MTKPYGWFVYTRSVDVSASTTVNPFTEADDRGDKLGGAGIPASVPVDAWFQKSGGGIAAIRVSDPVKVTSGGRLTGLTVVMINDGPDTLLEGRLYVRVGSAANLAI